MPSRVITLLRDYRRSVAAMLIVIVLIVSVLCAAVLSGSTTNASTGPPLHLIVLTRHGEREPLMLIPDREAFELGELTEYGHQTMRHLGARLAETHAQFLRTVDRSYVLYTNDSRCIDTAREIALGMNLTDVVEESLAKLILEEPNGLIHLPEAILRDLVQLMEGFEQTLPPCVRQISQQVFSVLKGSPPQKLPEQVELLIGFLVADSVDTIRMQNAPLPFNLSYTMDCLPKTVPLVTDEMFADFSELCMKSFCRQPLNVFLEELRYVRSGGPERIVSVFGLSDVHIQGLMMALRPNEHSRRPLFGAQLVFEVNAETAVISHGREPIGPQQPLVVLPLAELIRLVHEALI